jgi:hypothetical protein
VFPALDLYPTGLGETIVIGTASPLDNETREGRATALQEQHRFRFALPQLLQRRLERPPAEAAKAEVITDDFAPADVYDVTGKEPRRR